MFSPGGVLRAGSRKPRKAPSGGPGGVVVLGAEDLGEERDSGAQLGRGEIHGGAGPPKKSRWFPFSLLLSLVNLWRPWEALIYCLFFCFISLLAIKGP